MSQKSQPTLSIDQGDPRGCSIAGALSVFGDKWSLLAVREMARGNTRFEAMLADTGATRDMLTNRLRRLVDLGLVQRTAYQEHPPRYDYLLTAIGLDLMPVLVALRQWGDRHLPGLPPDALLHDCGHELDPVLRCGACGQDVQPDSVQIVARDRL